MPLCGRYLAHLKCTANCPFLHIQYTRRERIISLLDRLTINVIPPQVDLDAVKYVTDPHRGLVVTDEKSFFLEITEFTALR
jgi:hypothetical protein